MGEDDAFELLRGVSHDTQHSQPVTNRHPMTRPFEFEFERAILG
jgi:hypothetical protein